MNEPPRVSRVFRFRDLFGVVGLKPTQITKLIEKGKFPRPIKISDGGRAVAWLEADLAQWQAERIAERDAAAAKGGAK